HKERGTKMKKLTMLFAAAVLTIAMSSVASAQATANGTLAVTATVNGSITLVFNSDASGVPLTGANTNTAALAFGNVSAFGTSPAGVTTTTGASNFTVSTPVDVLVNKFNSASANYTLKAQLASADAANAWSVAGTTVTSAAQATITATGAYGANAPETIAITVPFTTTSGTNISNTINFQATAN
ncbi:MAG: hypothetical protein ACRD4I_08180, partial [Candidatus Angelobacter sp.]